MVSRGRLVGVLTGLLLLVGAPVSAQTAAVTTDKADARILIDISGSMRKNDPQNLRRPALRLLVGLMPTDARAGVWTFGQYVNMLVPLGKVDENWKRKARAGAGEIASPGQFTNIEDVIRRSIADWEGAATEYRRHLILLTDGMVDISKQQSQNSASRQRILEELLPILRSHGAQVHTIALSERADHELMQTLSRETGGWYEQVNNAEQLQRIFLRIFEKVGRPDTVPLKDNKFLVDSSIQEVTLLVFRQEKAEPTRIIPPSGEAYDAKTLPDSVSWHRDVGYDMLTITQPETGEWQVQAALDPDNRVIVVTDLKMHSSTLPSRFVLGEALPLSVTFTNQDKQITRQDFLDVVNLKSGYIDANGVGEERPLFDDGQEGDPTADDGEFTFLVGPGIAPGLVELVITAQGKTFEREQRQTFELADPIEMGVEPTGDGADLLLSLRADGEIVNLESLQFAARMISSTGEEQPVILLPGQEAGVSEATLSPASLVGEWTLSVSVSGMTQAGSKLELTLDPVAIEGTATPPPPPAPVHADEGEAVSAIEPEPVAEEEDEFLFQAALVGGGNLLLLLIGGVTYWLWRRRKNKDADELQIIEDEEPVFEEQATLEEEAVK